MSRTDRDSGKVRGTARKAVARTTSVALAFALALCMSVMMVPSVAFAGVEYGSDKTKVYVNAEGEDVKPEGSLGDIAADSSYTYGLRVWAECGHSAEVTAGNVTAEESYVAVKVVSADKGTTADVDVGLASGKGTGVQVSAWGSRATVSAKGASGSSGTGAYIYSDSGGHASLLVLDGDVSGGEQGIEFANRDRRTGGRLSALVNGIVSGGESGVYVTDFDNIGNVDLAAWKIEHGEGGRFLKVTNSTTGDKEDAFAATVKYIARVSEAGATASGSGLAGNLRAAYADGKALGLDGIVDEFRVAHEGETIYLAVDDGYEITSARNGDTPLQKGADGRYSYTVQRGGGIDLLAAVRELAKFAVTFKNDDGTVLQSGEVYEGATPEYTGATPTKAATDQHSYEFEGWSPAVGPVKAAATYTASYKATTREYLMSFDLGGGTIDGKTTYTVPAAYGSTIALRAPVREGYEFQYWEGSRYYAGDLYKVEGPHSFKAIWKEAEPAPGPEPEPSPEPEPVPAPAEQKATPAALSDGTAPRTGDGAPAAPAIAALLASACALGICRVRTSRRPAGKHARR